MNALLAIPRPSSDASAAGKKTAHTAAPVDHVTDKAFTAWQKRLNTAIAKQQTAGRATLALVLEARDAGHGEKAVRAAVVAAYIAAGSNEETARKRGADAVAVFKSDAAIDALPAGLQGAASKVRKDKAGTQRAPRTPTGEAAGAADKAGGSKNVSALELLHIAINQLKIEVGDDLGALSILSELADLAEDITSRVAGNNAKPVKQTA